MLRATAVSSTAVAAVVSIEVGFADSAVDRIVPPASAMAAAARLRQGNVHIAAGGHIGMVAGAGAEAALWRPLHAWLSGLQ